MRKAGKITIMLFICIAGILSSTSCEKKSTESEPVKTPLTFSAGIKTRAVDNTWHPGDCIGITSFKAGTRDFAQGRHNNRYTTQGDGGFTADADHVIYYPMDGSQVDLRGYYPYNTALNEDCLCGVNVANQTDLSAINLMTFDCFTGASKHNPEVTVQFKHRLTKLIFKFHPEDEGKEIKIKKLLIDGMKTTATYCLFKEQLTIADDSNATLDVPIAGTSTQAIVLPRAAGAGVTFTITTEDDLEFTATLNNDQELLPGFKYTFNIKLINKDVPLVLKGIIQEWMDGGIITIDSQPVVLDTGKQETIGFKKDDKITLYHEDLEVTQYTYNGTDWIPETLVCWENIGDGFSPKVTLRAEFIRQDPLNAQQMPEVFLAETEATRFQGITLNFKLAPAKVMVVLKSTSDTEPDKLFTDAELESATVLLNQYTTGGTLTHGVFAPGTTPADIPMVDVAADKKQKEALVEPQKKNGVLALIDLGGNTYKVEQTDELSFEAGKVYTITVNMLKSELSPAFTISYTDWVDGEAIEKDATPVDLFISGQTKNFKNGDAFTLYLDGQTEALATYTYTGTQWNADKEVYWQNLGDGNSPTITFRATFKRKNQLNPMQMDEVFVAKAIDCERFGQVNLHFTLAPAKIVVKLKSESAVTTDCFTNQELESATVLLNQYKTGGSIVNGVFTPGSALADIPAEDTADKKQKQALIEPQKKNGLLAVITLKGNQYKVEETTERNFEPGKVYTITVNMLKSNITPAFNLSQTDWVDAGDIPKDATPVNIAISGQTDNFTNGDSFTLYLDGQTAEVATYIYNGSAWTPNKDVYWEEIGDGSSATVTFRAEFKREGKLHNSQMDEVFVAEALNCARFGVVNIAFKLVPTQIIVKLESKSTAGKESECFLISELESATVELKDYLTGGVLTNGVFTSGSTLANIATAKIAGNQTHNQALLQPQKKSGVLAVITLGGNKYEVKQNTELNFEAGKIYTITVNMLKTDLAPAFKLSYTDWVDAPKLEIAAKPINLSATTGTTTQFELGDKIKLYDVAKNSYLTTYEYKGSNKWATATGEPTIYWEDLGDGNSARVKLRAEFIRTSALHTTQLPELFLAETECDRFGLLDLQFKLIPAKVRIRLKSEANPRNVNQEYDQAALAGATFNLPGYDNCYTLANGVFTKNTGSGNITPAKVSGQLQWEALIIPQIRNGKFAEVSVGGNTYNIEATSIEFKEGECLEITVNVLKNAIIGFSASYTDWNPVQGNEYTAFRIVQEGTTSNFKVADKLSLYYNYGSTSKEFISDFQYQGITNDGKHPWLPVAPTNVSHWENLNDPSPHSYNFYAVSTLLKAPLGSNQMDDVMYAEHMGIARFGAINLSFIKKTAKIIVLLESKDDTFSKAELESATITLPGYEIGAQYNGIDYNDNGTGTGTITPHKIADVNNNPAWTALFEPQTIAANVALIKITINGNEYELKLNSTTTFDVAKQYTYTINLKKMGIGFATSYSDWTAKDGGNHNVGLD